jgi:hypothetical protein
LPDLEDNASVKTLAFIVNPIAGMGGAVGLKGTDGKTTLNKALALGAKPITPTRAKSFLSGLEPFKKRVRLIVGAGNMGEDAALNCGFACRVLGKRKDETTSKDTKDVTKRIKEVGADLLVFCVGPSGGSKNSHRVSAWRTAPERSGNNGRGRESLQRRSSVGGVLWKCSGTLRAASDSREQDCKPRDRKRNEESSSHRHLRD